MKCMVHGCKSKEGVFVEGLCIQCFDFFAQGRQRGDKSQAGSNETQLKLLKSKFKNMPDKQKKQLVDKAWKEKK